MEIKTHIVQYDFDRQVHLVSVHRIFRMVLDPPDVFHTILLDLYYHLGEIIFELKIDTPANSISSAKKKILYTVPEKFNEDVMRSIMYSIPFEWYWPNNETMTG